MCEMDRRGRSARAGLVMVRAGCPMRSLAGAALVGVLLLTSLAPPVQAGPAAAGVSRGVGAYATGRCSYFIVESSSGYALLQWFGGTPPNTGEQLVGEFESYGLPELYNLTTATTVTVWADDFWMSRTRVVDRFYERCRLRLR